LRGSNKLI